MRLLGPLSMLVALLPATLAFAADPQNPDWPCMQRRVPQLSAATVWQGPPIDTAINQWRDDPEVSRLVGELAARRVPVEEAQKAATEFITEDPAKRDERATVLFAGLFDTLNQERGDVIAGLERLTRRQREFVHTIEADNVQLRQLQRDPNANPDTVADLTRRVDWGTRIFEERRRTIRYVCEVPVLIEKRLFVLARAMQQAIQ